MTKRESQRLRILQNKSAVPSASYTAEWALAGFHFNSADTIARASTVWPKKTPESVAVSKELKLCKGNFEILFLLKAAFIKDKSKDEL